MGADRAVIQLVTRCGSAEEFIERFARFATATDIVVPALPHVSVGAAGQFAICLKDRSVMMKGRCEVTEIRPVAVAPGAATPPSIRALMRLRLREMDAHSCGIHLRLMERHASSSRFAAVPVGTPVADVSAPTIVEDARPPLDTQPAAISPATRSETRVPGATFTLPANPLSDLDAADLGTFVELKLLEANGAIDAARRIGRRVVLSASCLLLGMLLGSALRPGSPSAGVVPPTHAAAPVAPPPSIAEAPAGGIPAPESNVRPAIPRAAPPTRATPPPSAGASSDRREPDAAQRGRRAGTQRARRSTARAVRAGRALLRE
jgi:hypothetical protein